MPLLLSTKRAVTSLLLGCILLLLVACGSLPKDDVLLRHFNEHSGELDQLVKVVSQSSEVLSEAGRWPVPPGKIVSHAEEQIGFEALEKAVGSHNIGIRDYEKIPNQPEIFFEFGDKQDLTGWTTKGIAHLSAPPVSSELDFIVSSLDGPNVLRESEVHYFFRPINGNWYLYKQVVR